MSHLSINCLHLPCKSMCHHHHHHQPPSPSPPPPSSPFEYATVTLSLSPSICLPSTSRFNTLTHTHIHTYHAKTKVTIVIQQWLSFVLSPLLHSSQWLPILVVDSTGTSIATFIIRLFLHLLVHHDQTIQSKSGQEASQE